LASTKQWGPRIAAQVNFPQSVPPPRFISTQRPRNRFAWVPRVKSLPQNQMVGSSQAARPRSIGPQRREFAFFAEMSFWAKHSWFPGIGVPRAHKGLPKGQKRRPQKTLAKANAWRSTARPRPWGQTSPGPVYKSVGGQTWPIPPNNGPPQNAQATAVPLQRSSFPNALAPPVKVGNFVGFSRENGTKPKARPEKKKSVLVFPKNCRCLPKPKTSNQAFSPVLHPQVGFPKSAPAPPGPFFWPAGGPRESPQAAIIKGLFPGRGNSAPSNGKQGPRVVPPKVANKREPMARKGSRKKTAQNQFSPPHVKKPAQTFQALLAGKISPRAHKRYASGGRAPLIPITTPGAPPFGLAGGPQKRREIWGFFQFFKTQTGPKRFPLRGWAQKSTHLSVPA